MTPLALFAMAGCLAVNPASDHILASDFTPQFPEMAGAPANAVVALAPAPGVTRVFRVAELHALAARFSFEAAPGHDICFERRVSVLPAELLLDAMHRTLPGARIELLDSSRQPAPEGEIEFPLAGLRRGLADTFWTGSVRFAGNRRFSVWAHVKVSIHVVRIVAAVDLHPGNPIGPSDITTVSCDEFPATGTFASSPPEVIGKWPRAPIPAGSPIRPRQLEAARDVLRGDEVEVDVRNGGAILKLTAIAEGSGAAGEIVTVRNPDSQKHFRARVERKGLVSIDAAKVNP